LRTITSRRWIVLFIIAARKAQGKKKSRRNPAAQLRGETVKVTLTKQSKIPMIQQKFSCSFSPQLPQRHRDVVISPWHSSFGARDENEELPEAPPVIASEG
jgi:hypothetical protein